MSALFPHLPYAEAVYADLAGADMRPPLIEVGLSDDLELTVTASWPGGHQDLAADVWPGGMVLRWSHVTGWRAATGQDPDDSLVMPVDSMASPAAVAAAGLHLSMYGLSPRACPVMPRPAERWARARELDRGLAEWESREDTRG